MKNWQEKRGKFYYTPTINYKTTWIPLGADKGEALVKYHKFINKEIEGVTINQLLDNYIRSVDYTTEKLSLRTMERYDLGMEKVREFMGNLDVKEVDAIMITRFIESSGGGVSTIGNGWVSPLSNAFKRGIKDGIVRTTPFRKGDIQYTKKRVRVRVVEEHELIEVMMCMHANTGWVAPLEQRERISKQSKLFMEISMLTGLRAGDVLSINKDSITEEGLVIHVQKRKKAHQALCFKWTPKLRELVDQVGDLFEGLTPQAMSTRFKRAADKAGIKDIRMHDIRRWVLQEAKRRGVDATSIQGMAGHSNLSQTMDYTLGIPDNVETLSAPEVATRPKLRLVK